MSKILFSAIIATAILFSVHNVALADELLDEYNAYIGQDDLFNSNNERLTQPWQVIRQDRANFHKFGISQPGDESDGFFDTVANRAAAENMVRDGAMAEDAFDRILEGDVMINVRVFSSPDGDYMKITVN